MKKNSINKDVNGSIKLTYLHQKNYKTPDYSKMLVIWIIKRSVLQNHKAFLVSNKTTRGRSNATAGSTLKHLNFDSKFHGKIKPC